MRIAILANAGPSYFQPMAEGLDRMLRAIGVNSDIHYEGLGAVRPVDPAYARNGRNALDTAVRWFRSQRIEGSFRKFASRLAEYQAIIVVAHQPLAYLQEFLREQQLRTILPDTPIILYDLIYLPSGGPCARWLLDGSPRHGVPQGEHSGMRRYDWYLCATVQSEWGMPGEYPMHHVIGLNFESDTLFVEPRDDFHALLDFRQPQYEAEREVQICALRESNVEYTELRGKYPSADLRALYRRASIFFLAHEESFGLPISEAQLCGAQVFSPYVDWCPAYWLKADSYSPGPGELPATMPVYGNDRRLLIDSIQRARREYDPGRIREEFVRRYPQYYEGDLDALRDFASKLEAGEINARSHQAFPSLAEVVAAVGI